MSSTSSTMKAVQMSRSSPETTPTLSLVEVPIPSPKHGEVLVKIHASLINPSDLINVKGGFPYTTYPRIPGRDFAGTVASPSSTTTTFKTGTRVFGTSGNTISFTQDGVHAEYVVVSEALLTPTPDSLSDIQASTIGVPYTAAWTGMKRAGLAKGETVLVIGSSGSVGTAAIRIAAAWECTVIPAARNLQKGSEGGVDLTNDPTFKTAMSMTKNKGVDVIFDTVGSPSVLTAAVSNALAVNGRVGFISAPRSGSTGLEIDMLQSYRKNQSFVGTNTLVYGPEEFVPVLREVGGMFETGKMEAPAEEGLVRVGLEGVVDAYEEMKKGGRRKFVVVME